GIRCFHVTGVQTCALPILGYSPIEYFNHLKIQHACQLLQFSDRRIFEIALAIGIEDPYYFSRLFSTQMGISPKQYRKQWTLSKRSEERRVGKGCRSRDTGE